MQMKSHSAKPPHRLEKAERGWRRHGVRALLSKDAWIGADRPVLPLTASPRWHEAPFLSGRQVLATYPA